MTRHKFAELMETEGKAVFSFCYQLTGKREDAEDLYQDTMLKAMECQDRIDDKSGNPKSFLIGIAARLWKNKKRKYARRQRIAPKEYIDNEEFYGEVADAGLSPEDSYISRELCRLVRMETAELKEKYRIPVYMYYSAEMTVEEIAQSLHIPQGTVKSRLYTARTIIGKKLEEHGYEK